MKLIKSNWVIEGASKLYSVIRIQCALRNVHTNRIASQGGVSFWLWNGTLKLHSSLYQLSKNRTTGQCCPLVELDSIAHHGPSPSTSCVPARTRDYCTSLLLGRCGQLGQGVLSLCHRKPLSNGHGFSQPRQLEQQCAGSHGIQAISGNGHCQSGQDRISSFPKCNIQCSACCSAGVLAL